MKNILLAKSKNCSVELEAWKAERRNSVKGLGIAGIICFIFWILIFEPNSDGQESFFALAFMLSGLMLMVIWNRLVKGIKNQSDYFSSLCSTEYLMIYEDKICGESSKGDLLLSIEQIDRVSHIPEEHIKKDCFYNERLVIYDVVGNCYNFFSFSNARELEMVIKNLLAKGEN